MLGTSQLPLLTLRGGRGTGTQGIDIPVDTRCSREVVRRKKTFTTSELGGDENST